ncbi:nucleotidyl transferase AbiEii/AbiGii toxin family protein [Wolbachia endosymbiont of Pentalonia nigronervosa]|uniref:nucleotidyl transferase AbiEii/AbiGii toxin family protein n=1 Tax=Wolbachia endosymbiont of Pentalonia nigronervosa TaxID=1301914 RepID=UPI00165FCCC1|nr:nucleotidyl transferase AbiEii/AbiGii toxin family protein [Wolbachia endosymbiont of Pentalonia nigronervosa]MBD0391997.1 nucleotidyl transferase AbiEii/AbiGii toxin family protein [Wolbachia endosymbiont of Pentalonia nigronervosa]
MIPRRFIQEWSKVVPWQEPRQIEQDLIINSALLKLYNHSELKKSLALRGGTALNKLFFELQSRYSEDIDLVQVNAEPVGHTIDCIRTVMDLWLGKPNRSFSDGLVTLSYRVVSDDGFPIRLKIEINTREHVSILGFSDHLFSSKSSWVSGSVTILTFQIEELLGTKLRALYQRRKGRDLYDLYVALTTIHSLDIEKIIHCFYSYMRLNNTKVSKSTLIKNVEMKLKNKEFYGDMLPLLPHKHAALDLNLVYSYVHDKLFMKL